jgi:putative membrane protein
MTGFAGAFFVIADNWDMHDSGAGWWIVMMLGMLIFWGLVIAGVVWLVRELSGRRPDQGSERPLDVLQRRLAEGDISVEEYERRREILESPKST